MYSSPTREVSVTSPTTPGMPRPQAEALQGITLALKHGAVVSYPGQRPAEAKKMTKSYYGRTCHWAAEPE